jgi:CubicO group peptidase (beta-lactamase class C family)
MKSDVREASGVAPHVGSVIPSEVPQGPTRRSLSLQTVSWVWIVVVLIALPLPTFLTAQTKPLTCAELKKQMQDSHIPDVAVSVLQNGHVASSYCSLDGNTLSPQSVFEAASLSKPVFAIGVLALVKDHKLDLDRPLESYLSGPYRHQQNPFGDGPTDVVLDPRLKQVTARMVLSHTTGMPNWSRTAPLTFLSDPGQRWSYSGEGYIYLQRIVESITGEPLDVYLRKAVLEPLGMTHSSFVWEERFASTLLAGHNASGAVDLESLFFRPLAASTLYTTLDDYTRFLSHLLSPPRGSPFALAESEQVVVRPDLKLAWGLGLAIEDDSPVSFFHWGSNPGFQSFFLCQPKTGRAVLYFTDSDNGLDLVDSIVDRTVPGPHPSLRFPMLHPKD